MLMIADSKLTATKNRIKDMTKLEKVSDELLDRLFHELTLSGVGNSSEKSTFLLDN